MPPDREVAAALAEQFSDRTIARLAKTVARAIRAGVRAAGESPEPPEVASADTPAASSDALDIR
jgi:hypothetical protein